MNKNALIRFVVSRLLLMISMAILMRLTSYNYDLNNITAKSLIFEEMPTAFVTLCVIEGLRFYYSKKKDNTKT